MSEFSFEMCGQLINKEDFSNCRIFVICHNFRVLMRRSCFHIMLGVLAINTLKMHLHHLSRVLKENLELRINFSLMFF